MDAVTRVPVPVNEPNLSYAPGTPERAELTAEIDRQTGGEYELGQTIGGVTRLGLGELVPAVQPHKHAHVLGRMADATDGDVREAIDAARAAAPAWRAMSPDDRAAILLRAADLLAGPWRARVNAATMLGQSKSVQQAEIDAACELIDFWRFNVAFARRLYEEQPLSTRGVWNRQEMRPLEGFVLAITPFNFTAIAGNLPTAPALMGNVVVWKPSPTQTFSAWYVMRLLEEAGLPPGVINMVTGDGAAVSRVALTQPDLAGIHFTGSTGTFRHLWRTVGENISTYRGYPRIVGETGGKDFVVAHSSADPDVLRTALVRGAFEYQGQKCSAASRAYVPRSVWSVMRDGLLTDVKSLTMGDVTGDLSTFMGAVIDERAFAKNAAALERARATDSITVLAGGTADDSVGYFVQPTVLECDDPEDEVFRTEYFGPILAVHVYDDGDYGRVLAQMADVAPYALTGAVVARDRDAIAAADAALRFSAGNFYINDKPTGSIVGQQPFGGARASGTNDKAGSVLNLARWASARVIKEAFVPPTDWRYPHMG
ncbi:1-pyrroline-5-carboxylate dehydrogenase [Nocardiopsis mwathae]|uniref:L-glutamate gamma-semialdehyde dehydrogenase n=1 Tax=Nocardiopsis mwathae TaxID=1472723 RepID=A0A7W9YDM9_9ACTN|nr:L-glutamate gamma-semialdehyde dehydrogenase [Nocardiopsis mwathae]MBB6170159.1 1-pyrroline-5-carboxylate dehydrogenase [Nocardiopsis mwathae]